MRASRGTAFVTSLALALASVATIAPAIAQPAAAGPPAVAPGAWYRFTFTDGRVVDGQLVGGDAVNYFVATAGGTFSIARAGVSSVVAFAPAPAPIAPAPIAPAPVPAPPADDTSTRNNLKAGLGAFVLIYGLTAFIALERDSDPDARLGLIPVAGPILWTASDEDDWGDDGWDWLGFLGSFMQFGCLYGAAKPNKSRSSKVTVTPTSSRHFSGLVVGGTF